MAFDFRNALYDNPPATTPDEAGSAGAGTGTGTGAGSSTGSPSAPALITNAYDPNRPTPYVAPPPVEQPKVEPPPTTQPPPRSQSPGMVGRGRAGAITSIATIGDQILRGAMQGRDQARQMQAAKTQKLMSGLQYNYAKAQANAIDIAQQPDVMAALQKDPKTLTTADQKTLAPLNEALAGTSSAWTMLDQMTNRYFFGDPNKTKGKGKGKKSDQPDDPMAMAASQDPQQKLKGIMMIRSKIGDTTPMKIREMLAKVSDPAAQAGQLGAQNKLALEQARQQLLKASPGTPEYETARKHVEELTAAMSGKPESAGSWKRIDGTLNGQPYSYMHDEKNNRNTTMGGAELQPEALQGFAPAAKTSGGKPAIGWSKDANGRYFSAQIDPHTNQFVKGTENYNQEPPAYLRESIRTGEYHWVDEQGMVHGTPTTSVSRHAVPGTGGSGGGGGGAVNPQGPTASPSVHPSVHPSAPPPATGATSTPHIAGDRILGDKGAPVDKTIRASTLRSSDQLRKLVPMWESSSKYMQGGKFDSAGDLSMVISAVRSMNPASSRLPDRELRLEMERGSYGERAQRWYTTATTGTMPDHMRSELWDVINAEIPNAARHTVTDWKTSMQGRPLPDHLKQFDTGGGGGGGDRSTPHTPAPGNHPAGGYDAGNVPSAQ